MTSAHERMIDMLKDQLVMVSHCDSTAIIFNYVLAFCLRGAKDIRPLLLNNGLLFLFFENLKGATRF